MRIRLLGVKESGQRLIRGNLTKVYSFESLPADDREKLTLAAKERGYANPLKMLLGETEVPAAPPLSQLDDEEIGFVVKLRAAQSRMIERRNDLSLTSTELNAIGIEDYRREFGHAISARYCEELFKRTLRRAGESQDFTRLELYLRERPKLKSAAPAKPVRDDLAGMQAIRLIIASPGVNHTTVWSHALDLYREKIEAGENPAKFRRTLLDVLFANVPGIAATRKALDKAFKRKLKRWQEKDVAGLDDGRKKPKKEKRGGMSEESWKYAVYLSGVYENIDLAYREWRASEKVSAEEKALFADSHEAPECWRNAVKHEANLVAIHIRGPRNAKLQSAYISRDPDSLASGDSDQSDDLTLPIIWWDELPGGEIFCGQGQLLAWIDERSWMIYNLNLISDGAYTGFSIRNSWTNKADTWGLPRNFIYVENGIWRNAKVFVGSKGNVGTSETEIGLRRLGIKFRHAQLPRGKLIERLFGSVQDLLHREPGYAGRFQVLDRFEAVHKQLALVKSGKEHPSKFFLSKAQLMERLLHFSDKLNSTAKGGEYHAYKGYRMSPKEVYEDRFTTPLVKIPDELRYMLADNKIETPVGRNGITFRFGNRTFNYKNYRTGQLRGRRVIAWFSPERPELLGVTNLDGSEPFVVQRSTSVPNHDESGEFLAQAMKENAEHNRYGKELMRSLKPFFAEDFKARMFRPVVVDAQATETANEFKRQAEEITSAEKEQRSVRTKARKVYNDLGFRVPENLNSEELDAAEKLKRKFENIV